jgi:hypothetical protein
VKAEVNAQITKCQVSVGPNMAVVPLLGYLTFWMYKHITLKFKHQELVRKLPDAEAQLRQLFRVPCNTENVAGYAPVSVVESDEWKAVVNTVQENRANNCKALSGKTLYSALYGHVHSYP